MSPPRVLLAKPGLDGHDRGVKVIAMALRDAGAEIIYLGLRQSAAQIVRAAQQENADIIACSVLSGAHLALSRQLLDERERQMLGDVPVVIGGTIPLSDVAVLEQAGIAAVYPTGSSLSEVVSGILEQARRTAGGWNG